MDNYRDRVRGRRKEVIVKRTKTVSVARDRAGKDLRVDVIVKRNNYRAHIFRELRNVEMTGRLYGVSWMGRPLRPDSGKI
jgi:hypothetical protein